MTHTWCGLRSLSDEKLVECHDGLLKSMNFAATVAYYQAELRHREQLRLAESTTRFTKRIFWLTVAIAFFTVVNVGIVAWVATR